MSQPTPADPRPARGPTEGPIPEDAQRVFDTVAGPNLRLRDNLIQLAVIVAGTFLGAGAGAAYAWSVQNHPGLGAFVGGFAGVVVSLLLSGAVIGLVRAVLALKRR